MIEQLPDPLTAAECDLRDFPFMPVDIARLFNSEFHARATDAEWRAAVTLWLKSYHQVPAASVPDDDVALARLAEFGRDLKGWKKVREVALYGWVKCSDGRLYHPVVAEKATEAWARKKAFRDRTEKARQARLQQRLSQNPTASVTDHPTDSVTRTTGTEDRGQGQRTGTGTTSLGESAAKPRPTRKCPPTFEVTPDLRAWAAEKTPAVDWVLETEKFRDHTFATAISDWPGAWRNWLRRATPDRPPPHPSRAASAPSRHEQRQQTIAGLTGTTPTERTDHGPRQSSAIDVDARIVNG